MAEKKPTYAQAIAEIESIVKEIEEEDVDVDHLLEKVKRASSLIKYCRDRLRDTEAEVRKVLSASEKEETKQQE